MFVSFVLEGHLPYLRQHAPAPAGEEPLHRLIAGSLLPLLRTLADLHQSGLQPRLSLAFSPLLLDQLADPVVLKHFVLWIDGWIERRSRELQHFSTSDAQHHAYLARFELEWLRETRRLFVERWNRQPVMALRELSAIGVLNPLASPATHAVLPLLGSSAARRAQLEVGLLETATHLGRPDGCWLPAAAWSEDLAELLADIDLRYVLLDPLSCPPGTLPAWLLPRRLAALPLTYDLLEQLWPPELGYRGDPLYRDTAAEDGYSARGNHGRAAYDPYHALRRAQEHAADFVERLVHRAADRPHDHLILPLHTDLIGVDWFEGTTWLQSVLTLCATHPAIELCHPDRDLPQLRSDRRVTPSVSAAAVGGLGAWQQAVTPEYRSALTRAEQQLTALAAVPHDNPWFERLLNQAARELLIAQSRSAVESPDSTAPLRRLQACVQLCDIAARAVTPDNADRELLTALEAADAPFPQLNYRVFH
jgi:1,4-alpha-glucan branching enzyme